MRTTLRGYSSGALIHQLERLFHHGTTVGLTEGELLERFTRGKDEAAFEALIARHGPMVLGVCRQLLRDPNDVDDAFQATFLVLVRKAATLQRRDLLGNWLYGVAFRVATRARVMAARRAAKAPHGQEPFDRLEGDRDGMDTIPDRASGLSPEPRPWLHEEVGRLPEKYRVPVVLCYFEALTHEEAAQRLGCPLGTVKGRLSRARELLRKRLNRRGMAFSATALASQLALNDARAVVSTSLQLNTIKAAQAVAGTTASSIIPVTAVSLHVAALTEGVLKAMLISRTKSLLLSFLVVCAVTSGVVIGSTRISDPDEKSIPVASQAASPSADKKKVAVVPASGPKPNPTDQKNQNAPASNVETAETNSDKPGGEPAPASNGGKALASSMASLTTAMLEGGFQAGGGGGFDTEAEFRQRLEIAQLSASLASWEKNPKNEAILKALEQPVPMLFTKETSLDFVLKYIRKKVMEKPNNTPIPIYLDPLGLQQAERTLDSSVVMDLDGVPLKTSLRLLLKQVGLAYCVRDGVLIISSVQGIREELAEAARELLGSGNEQVNMQLLRMMGIGPRGQGGAQGGGMGGMGQVPGRMGGGMGGGMGGNGPGGGMMSITPTPGSVDHR